MRTVILSFIFCFSLSVNGQYSQVKEVKLPPKDLKEAFSKPITDEYSRTHFGSDAFMKRQRAANIIYAAALVMTVVGVAGYESIAPEYFYAPASFWLTGFIIDRSSYYLKEED